MQKHIRTEEVWRELTEHSQIYHKILNNRKEETDMSDFLTEKNKKTLDLPPYGSCIKQVQTAI